MKKLLFAVLGLCISSCVFAESPQMQYIKRMYKESVKLESVPLDRRKTNYDYYLKYFDSNIREIYERDNGYQNATKTAKACIDYDVLWQGNDLNPKAKLTFIQPSADQVKVTIGATKGLEKRSVTYQVECQKDGNCKITEIFESGKPFTEEISKCLNKILRTEITKHRNIRNK
ncbi:hypothetical protein ABXR98_17150 [Snodgrassella alvi]|uniref:hypothetical protein n=1 Tax=Snodgrassella alvi TaxID=1196083 RepID=UPI0035B2C7F3